MAFLKGIAGSGAGSVKYGIGGSSTGSVVKDAQNDYKRSVSDAGNYREVKNIPVGIDAGYYMQDPNTYTTNMADQMHLNDADTVKIMTALSGGGKIPIPDSAYMKDPTKFTVQERDHMTQNTKNSWKAALENQYQQGPSMAELMMSPKDTGVRPGDAGATPGATPPGIPQSPGPGYYGNGPDDPRNSLLRPRQF